MDIHTPETLPAQLTDRKGTGLARELFTPDFWITGLAILKYIPVRSVRSKSTEWSSLLNRNTTSFATGFSQ